MTQKPKRNEASADVVTAHEVGVFVFCSEQWRLEYGLGMEPENQAAQEAGARHHARKATAERTAGRMLWIGRNVLLGGLILLFILWILSR